MRLAAALLVAAALLPGAAAAQSAGAIAGKSIVFTLASDSLPFVAYVAPNGKVFVALGFAGEEYVCGWRGRFGLNGQLGREQTARASARGQVCTFGVRGATSANYDGTTLSFSFSGDGEVTGQPGGGFLTQLAGRGPVPIQLAFTAAVSGGTCSASGASNIAGTRYGWQVTSCRVQPGNVIR